MNTKQSIVALVKATRFNLIDLAEIGKALNLEAAQLLPFIEELRRAFVLTGSCREGRYKLSAEQRAFSTSDGVGMVSIREGRN